jgi:hypothetical protein
MSKRITSKRDAKYFSLSPPRAHPPRLKCQAASTRFSPLGPCDVSLELGLTCADVRFSRRRRQRRKHPYLERVAAQGTHPIHILHFTFSSASASVCNSAAKSVEFTSGTMPQFKIATKKPASSNFWHLVDKK